MYTEIYKHPLRDAFCLRAKNLGIPPFIGTRKQCEKMQPKWEKKITELYEQFGTAKAADEQNIG